MRSNNPVFSRVEGFNQGGQATQGYAQFDEVSPTHAPASAGRMTLDSVVQTSGITLGVVVVTAAITWMITPSDPAGETTLGILGLAAMVGSLGGFVLSLVNSFKKVVSPPLVLAFCVFEGIMVGAFSKLVEMTFGTGDLGGLVVGAVAGTICAFVGTLAAYKFFNIRVSSRFRGFVVAAMIGFVGLSFFDFALQFFGASFGFNGFGTMGLIASVVGLGIAVLMLILDFDFIERGIANGLPARESWRAAFGLTVTLVWIYIQMLRILAILRGD